MTGVQTCALPIWLRFIRELEQEKPTLRMDKVNQILVLFGAELGVVELDRTYLKSL